MVFQQTSLLFDSAPRSLKAFVVWTSTVSAVTRWLGSTGAILCGIQLLAGVQPWLRAWSSAGIGHM